VTVTCGTVSPRVSLAPNHRHARPPDGYTLLLAGIPNAFNASLFGKLNFNFIRDIAPDYLCPIVSTAVSQIQGKQVKPIAILSKNRTPILPDLASAHEQGLIDFDAYIWNGIFLPRGTPTSIAEKLHDAAVAAMDTPDVQQRIKEMGGAVVSPERRSSEYLQKFVESEIKKWTAPIKASGVSMD
jgi:hypothetical protein